MFEVPAATAATTPEALPIVATDVVPLLHVPPEVVLLNVVLPPTQADNTPVIAEGAELTVKTALTEQPEDNV